VDCGRGSFPMSWADGRSWVKNANAMRPPATGSPMKVIRRAIRTGDRTVTLRPRPFLFGLLSLYGPRRNA